MLDRLPHIIVRYRLLAMAEERANQWKDKHRKEKLFQAGKSLPNAEEDHLAQAIGDAAQSGKGQEKDDVDEKLVEQGEGIY